MSFLKRFRKKEKDKSNNIERALKAQVKLHTLNRRFEEIQDFQDFTDEECEVPNIISNILPRTTVGSLGYGEIGERYPVSQKNKAAQKRIIDRLNYYQKTYGPDHFCTLVVKRMLIATEWDFLARSIKDKHTDTDVAFFGPEWGGWKSKTSDLSGNPSE